MRIPVAILSLLLFGSATCAAQEVELRPVTPEIYKDAALAAQRLMDKLDVNLDGVADMSDAEEIVSRGIGSAEQLAIQGAMRADLDGDGRITPEEMTAYARRNFDLLADTDGKIPGRNEDFDQYLQHQMDEFRNWDLNHDDIVTRQEVERFLTSENPRRSNSVRREYESYIKTMDTDGDGRITIAEMTRAFTRAATYPISKPAPPPQASHGFGLKIEQFASMQATVILREFDAGPDDVVTYAEAVKKGGKNCYLLSMDEERDGRITRAKIERRARAAAHVADVDKDGYLSQGEMMEAWTMLHGLKPWKLPEIAPVANTSVR